MKEQHLVDEYVMTCERTTENNSIYVIFSPHPFVKAKDSHESNKLPRLLNFPDFNKWLVNQRKHDEQMNVRLIPFTIRK